MVLSHYFLKGSASMIRRLTALDQETLLAYAGQEPAINNFIIGDVEQCGFDVDYMAVYGEFDEEMQYLSLLLFYRESAIYYSHQARFSDAWLAIIDTHQPKFISGKKTVIDLVSPLFPSFEKKEMYFAKADKILDSSVDESLEVIALSSEEQCGKLYDLLVTIDEFSVRSQEKNKFISDKMASLAMGKTYFIEKNNRIVATVAATAESSLSAVVVGVATSRSVRNKGLASALMSSLMKEYIHHKNKALCLFYDNPLAANIYKRLGFQDIDMWVMLSKE